MTEEEAKQAIVEAALNWDDDGGRAKSWTIPSNQRLHDAIDAYRKATTPEPFDTYVRLPLAGGIHSVIADRETWFDQAMTGQIWKATVTPIERVR